MNVNSNNPYNQSYTTCYQPCCNHQPQQNGNYPQQPPQTCPQPNPQPYQGNYQHQPVQQQYPQGNQTHIQTYHQPNQQPNQQPCYHQHFQQSQMLPTDYSPQTQSPVPQYTVQYPPSTYQIPPMSVTFSPVSQPQYPPINVSHSFSPKNVNNISPAPSPKQPQNTQPSLASTLTQQIVPLIPHKNHEKIEVIVRDTISLVEQLFVSQKTEKHTLMSRISDPNYTMTVDDFSKIVLKLRKWSGDKERSYDNANLYMGVCHNKFYIQDTKIGSGTNITAGRKRIKINGSHLTQDSVNFAKRLVIAALKFRKLEKFNAIRERAIKIMKIVDEKENFKFFNHEKKIYIATDKRGIFYIQNDSAYCFKEENALSISILHDEPEKSLWINQKEINDLPLDYRIPNDLKSFLDQVEAELGILS